VSTAEVEVVCDGGVDVSDAAGGSAVRADAAPAVGPTIATTTPTSARVRGPML
jgi:hypothetical protein